MGKMLVSLDEKGRLTLPYEIRKKVKTQKFILSMDGESITIIPVPEPHAAKNSIKITYSIEELEESQENYVLKRDTSHKYR
jgi:bifunctional DNA-binding transcriptional regulator/antitoxin component of YhaV-PrlF toxin-antitoxin module